MAKTSDLLSRVAEIRANAKSRPVAEEQKELCKVFQLPLWPEEARGVPNAALRSALFGAIKKGARAYLERKEIHAQEGIRIIYTGARLDQGDLDVWETVLHMARMQALGNECRITAYQLLKALGKTDTGINRATLDRRLSRMKATGVDVKVGKFSYEGSLIDEVYRAEETKEYVIRLNPKLSSLFAVDQFTQVDWSVRHALDGKPLAQWLHGYYASHAKPYPVTVSMLLKLCGSENEDPGSGKQKLKKALDALTEASNANGQTFSYSVEQDIVEVSRKPSTSQRRHLAKKAAKQRKLKF